MSVGLPSHYQLRLEHISHEVSRLPRDAGNTVVLLGDAHVEDNPTREMNGSVLINMGIKEDELSRDCGATKDRLWLLPMARPGHVIIMAGMNDIKADRNPLELERCYHELIAQVRRNAPAAQIHLAMLPPTRDRYAKLMPHIALMNGILEEICEREKVQCVDLFSSLEDDEGLLCEDCTVDGFYLNDTGYEKLNERLERHLASGEAY